MPKFFKRWLNRIFPEVYLHLFRYRSVFEADETKLKWKWTQLTKEKFDKGWGWCDAPKHLQWYFQYYCDKCGGELTPGPTGGGTNQVCEKCRINYGCLPGALER